MRSESNSRRICLMNQIRSLWEQHVYWTRFFIISTVSDLPDLKVVQERLLRNPVDFAKILCPLYGQKAAGEFESLFTQHLTIGAELVNAAKNKNRKAVDDARRRWYQNADQLAAFLCSINSCWSEEKWKCMLYRHLEMTEKQVVLRLGGEYRSDIEMFDCIEKEALKMADYMSCGIAMQKAIH